MKKREIGNFALHTGIALVLVSLVLLHPWFLLLDVIVWMTLREQAQHRYDLTLKVIDQGIDYRDPLERLYEVEKRTFFDWSWFKWHHAGEIGQAALGALIALVAYEIFFV